MTTKTPGQGQVYLGILEDRDGRRRQGGNHCTLHIEHCGYRGSA
jgi:hypothetical protein